MGNKCKALTTSELLPQLGRPSGKRLKHVIIGDLVDIRLCDAPYYAVIEYNHHNSQQMHIKFTSGEKYRYSSQTINGNKVFLFSDTEENLNFLERKKCENNIIRWTNSVTSSTGDLIALQELILECVDKDYKKSGLCRLGLEDWYRNSARERILSNLSRLSVWELEDICQLIGLCDKVEKVLDLKEAA